MSLDPKIRDEALSDDPSQIKGRFNKIENFVGNADDVASYIPGGSDLANFLRYYATILYFDTSDEPGNILIDPYFGNLQDMPTEVMMTVIPKNDCITGLNTITFRRPGEADITFEIKRRNATTGAYENLTDGDMVRYSFCNMYLSDQGFFVISTTDGISSVINQINQINAFLEHMRKSGPDYIFDRGVVYTQHLQVGGIIQTGEEPNQLEFLTLKKGLSVENGTVDLSMCKVTMPEPQDSQDAVTVEYLNQRINEVMDNFAKISDKFIVGVEDSPEQDDRTQDAPIGTFYFKLK